MVTVFNRKRLVTDSSFQEIARVRRILEDNKIEFYTMTKRNSNVVLDGVYASMAANKGMRYSVMRGSTEYVYMIWSREKIMAGQ